MADSTKCGSGDSRVLPPVLKWAQRKDEVYITVALEDCSECTCTVNGNTFYFKGKGGTEKLEHEVTLELYGEIEVLQEKKCGRHREFTLIKKEKTANFWPRLAKDKKKLHYVKVDFAKWQDEGDASGEEETNQDGSTEAMMQSLANLQGGQLNQDMMQSLMNSQGGQLNQDEHDSDDEELPDLQ